MNKKSIKIKSKISEKNNMKQLVQTKQPKQFKYDLNSVVYFMHEKTIYEATVSEIRINNNGIEYKIEFVTDDLIYIIEDEENIFQSPDELCDSILNKFRESQTF